ncbi:DNA-processing protein DprA [Actinospica sp. MGRD01-02]|uniref:DNA-processing protein DprA n=1 Tax=Actinospica acidithermotolerans TaxID=2828514 RepID=A0A941IE70_9ACTN|nr:DNA-processing protein DprA [Actinospica acidithermotolerans]MBR7824895.1 DNA-processing protein DprA [Actinospica acidithermotolerans]
MSLFIPEIDYDDARMVRLMLSRLIEPDDRLFAALREVAAPAEMLRAILERGWSPPDWPAQLVERLEGRRAGMELKLPGADPMADLAAGAAVGARFLIPGDADWPDSLEDLGERAPFGIWMIGRFDHRAPSVAMVGARQCTPYGALAAAKLASQLARADVAIVSGAAIGVDGASHRGALHAGGATVAVLACGIDRSYPASHTELIQAIGQRGAVFAELPPGSRPTRFRFLSRNRLIAALGMATVVVEAAVRSGSLVTARLAAELGRAVFAVPGPVTTRESTGTNRLLCDGAIPAVDGPQVLAELGIEESSPVARRVEKSDTPSAATEIDPRAALVREALPTARSGRAAPVLTLAAETGLAPSEVLALLGRLAGLGQAVRTGGGWALGR